MDLQQVIELLARCQSLARILPELQSTLAEVERVVPPLLRDSLTQVWRRDPILELLQEDLAHAMRDASPFSIVMIDVDNMKQVNDTNGHLIGDLVLIEVTRRLRSFLRPYDRIGRIGGDEFLLGLANCHEMDAHALIERMRWCIAAEPIATSNGFVSVTASFGLATYYPGTKSGALEELRERADAALYRAKGRGKNCIVLDPLLNKKGRGKSVSLLNNEQ